MKKSKLIPYVVSVAAALAVGGLSAFVTRGGMDIYSDIKTPPLSPPGFIFPIVWTVLFILMGISAAIIYTSENGTSAQRADALKIYAASLAVNFAWSIVFFNKRAFLTAFVVLLLLLFLILKTNPPLPCSRIGVRGKWEFVLPNPSYPSPIYGHCHAV